jgi:hypothetical protein
MVVNADYPFVAVIGGLWNVDPAKIVAAKKAANEVGAELAKAGFGLLVYFSNDESLEPHVVAGYCEALANGAGAVRVRHAQSQQGEVVFKEEAARRDIFDYRPFPSDDWEAPFYRSLAEEEGVDAVLLLGGATSTLIAGQIAVARRLPILAIDAFGGSAAKIWSQLAQASPDKKHQSWGKLSAKDFVQQLKTECMARAAVNKERLRRENLFSEIVVRRQQTAFAASAFGLLLATLFLGMVYTPFPSWYPIVMFFGLIFAGATGALIRLVLWGTAESDPWVSFLLGSVAGFVVGLAYLIPQWVGAPGVLEPSADIVGATDKIQFASAILVAVSAGVGFDTVFNRLQKQAQEIRVGPS